eukprot:7338716-Ditylum_brightwellii.AAC.1
MASALDDNYDSLYSAEKFIEQIDERTFVLFTPTLDSLNNAIPSAKEHLLASNPKKEKPLFVLSKQTLIPLCNASDIAHLTAYNHQSEACVQWYRESVKKLYKAVIEAKDLWTEKLALETMKYKHNLIQSWKAMCTLEKGLTHHQTECQTV